MDPFISRLIKNWCISPVSADWGPTEMIQLCSIIKTAVEGGVGPDVLMEEFTRALGEAPSVVLRTDGDITAMSEQIQSAVRLIYTYLSAPTLRASADGDDPFPLPH